MILNESKRDEMLLPYLNILKERGIDMTLGKFKGVMLDKLSAQGGMHNLSMASNFYLAGAVRYYFNGDLTTNKDLSVLKGDKSASDNWNTEVCQRLDALIGILRNSYIDSVGEAWEQPEDFGNMPIEKLLKKYNKKINAALGIEDNTQNKKAEIIPSDLDPHVGNGYTFHILYSYADGTKYERYTAPGSWCITYGQGHYDRYIRLLGGIHYVIFLKDGYENVERKTGPGYTKKKPHDEYGNSMIALLQSNVDGRPVYITSRWNHGHYSDGTDGTEADYAYTPEEFYQITGVTPQDLKNIFEEWKRKSKDYKPKRESDPQKREKKLMLLRSLKYIQMRINGGEDPNGLVTPVKMLYGKMPERTENGYKPVNFRAAILMCKLPDTEDGVEHDGNVYFLVDKGKIIFDTVVEASSFWDFTMESAEKYYENTRYDNGDDHVTGKMHNVVIFKGTGGGYGLYDTRRHAFVEVGGTKRFKEIPPKYSSEYGSEIAPLFYQVKQSSRQIALINISNNMPLKLPNGTVWFDDMCCVSVRANRDTYNRTTEAHFAGTKFDSIIEIVADGARGEKYFYSVENRRFINLPSGEDIFKMAPSDAGIAPDEITPRVVRIKVGNYQVISYTRGYANSCFILVDANGELGNIGPFTLFSRIGSQYGNLISFRPLIGEENYGYNPSMGNEQLVFDLKRKQILKLNGKYIYVNGIESSWAGESYILIGVFDSSQRRGYNMIYDSNENAILENPYGYPNSIYFECAGVRGRNSMRLYTKPHRTFMWNEKTTDNPEFADSVANIDYNELKRIPLDNEQQYSTNQKSAEPMQTFAEAITANDIKQMVSEAIKMILNNGN